jgi:hypothetical protein
MMQVFSWEKERSGYNSLKNPVIDSYLAIYEAVDKELKEAEREIEKANMMK